MFCYILFAIASVVNTNHQVQSIPVEATTLQVNSFFISWILFDYDESVFGWRLNKSAFTVKQIKDVVDWC